MKLCAKLQAHCTSRLLSRKVTSAEQLNTARLMLNYAKISSALMISSARLRMQFMAPIHAS